MCSLITLKMELFDMLSYIVRWAPFTLFVDTVLRLKIGQAGAGDGEELFSSMARTT